jgi:hypothetical protein
VAYFIKIGKRVTDSGAFTSYINKTRSSSSHICALWKRGKKERKKKKEKRGEKSEKDREERGRERKRKKEKREEEKRIDAIPDSTGDSETAPTPSTLHPLHFPYENADFTSILDSVSIVYLNLKF